MFKLTALVLLCVLAELIFCAEQPQDSNEFKTKLLNDYNTLNHDIMARLTQLREADESSSSSDDDDDDSLLEEIAGVEKRFPKWGSRPKSLAELRNKQNEKRFPKWRANTDFKSLLAQKHEPSYYGERNDAMRKLWEKNMLEKNKIYSKNNMI